MMALHGGLALAALAVGLASALAYGARRRWIDAVLAAAAGLALAGTIGAGSAGGAGGAVGGPAHSGAAGAAGVELALDATTAPASLDGIRSIRLQGDGLRGAHWDDLAARPLAWRAPATPAIRLDFPAEVALGRMFTLTLWRSWRAQGRLQLLAENGELLAEARGDGPLSVQWLPPLAERLLLRARLLDADGKLVDQGPVPFAVTQAAPLRVRGRFGAPSFDLRALDDLLVASNAVIDWQVELGRNLRRSERARAAMAAPDLEIVDAAWFERAGDAGRAALLARVAAGAPLLVLGANAAEPGVWARSLGLRLVPQADNQALGTSLPMAVGALNPAAARAGEWQGGAGLWTRDWHKGRIGWLGVGGWHRHAIEAPRALALWWQDLLDRLRLRGEQELAWLAPAELPLPFERLEVCARGEALRKAVALSVPALALTLPWQRRPEHVDAACAALWPTRPGWLRMRVQGAPAPEGATYVYAAGDWALWQRAQRRLASARYAARTPAPAGAGADRALPAWPFALGFALAMLGLWWRERR